MRPAYFPPSDGYQPPEDPLVGVARQINNVAELKADFPELGMVGTGYSYLQEWTAQRGATRSAHRHGGFRRIRPHGALISGDARRCAGGQTTSAQAHLPHLQRLYHRPAQRHDLGLLPAGRFLQRLTRGRKTKSNKSRRLVFYYRRLTCR